MVNILDIYVDLYIIIKTYVNMYNIINSFLLKFLKIFISDHLAWQMIITDGEIVYVI